MNIFYPSLKNNPKQPRKLTIYRLKRMIKPYKPSKIVPKIVIRRIDQVAQAEKDSSNLSLLAKKLFKKANQPAVQIPRYELRDLSIFISTNQTRPTIKKTAIFNNYLMSFKLSLYLTASNIDKLLHLPLPNPTIIIPKFRTPSFAHIDPPKIKRPVDKSLLLVRHRIQNYAKQASLSKLNFKMPKISGIVPSKTKKANKKNTKKSKAKKGTKKKQTNSLQQYILKMSAPATYLVSHSSTVKLSVYSYLSTAKKWFVSEGWAFSLIAISIISTELSLIYKPMAGAYVNGAAFVALCSLAIWQKKYREIAISVAILPVAEMISLSLPKSSTLGSLSVFYSSILLLTLYYRYSFTISNPVGSSRLKLKGYLIYLPIMIVAGGALGLLGYDMLRYQYSFKGISFGLIGLLSVVFAFTEEMFFRGLIQNRASKVMAPISAAILSAVFYGIIGYGNSLYLPLIFGLIAGSALSFIYFKKENLLLTTTANAVMKLTFISLLAAFIYH